MIQYTYINITLIGGQISYEKNEALLYRGLILCGQILLFAALFEKYIRGNFYLIFFSYAIIGFTTSFKTGKKGADSYLLYVLSFILTISCLLMPFGLPALSRILIFMIETQCYPVFFFVVGQLWGRLCHYKEQSDD